MTVKLADGAGNMYEFGIHRLRTYFNPVGAVYVITRMTLDRFWREEHKILYIGQTGNLGQRMQEHLNSTSWISPSGANRVCVLVIEDQLLRSEVEAALVKEHQPPYNTYLKGLWL